jgi:23S rRNA pseudouridine1911/1915/1917 synthase
VTRNADSPKARARKLHARQGTALPTVRRPLEASAKPGAHAITAPSAPAKPATATSTLSLREPFVVSAAEAGMPLDRALRAKLDGASWGSVRRLIETGKVRVGGDRVLEPTRPLAAGESVELALNARRPSSEGLPASTIVYADSQVVVVEKPSGISSVPFEPNERGTLDELVLRLLVERDGARKTPLGIVHRLDKETSGLLVFARTLTAKRALKNQFRFHTVKRRYWAVALGDVKAQTLQSRLVQDRGDGLRGSTENPGLGRDATTHVRVVEALRDATLVECQLETGRTHQIRIHLAEAGHPLVGERVYIKGYAGQPIAAPRMMLHAFELGFEHPANGRPLHFASKMPADMQALIAELKA